MGVAVCGVERDLAGVFRCEGSEGEWVSKFVRTSARFPRRREPAAFRKIAEVSRARPLRRFATMTRKILYIHAGITIFRLE